MSSARGTAYKDQPAFYSNFFLVVHHVLMIYLSVMKYVFATMKENVQILLLNESYYFNVVKENLQLILANKERAINLRIPIIGIEVNFNITSGAVKSDWKILKIVLSEKDVRFMKKVVGELEMLNFNGQGHGYATSTSGASVSSYSSNNNNKNNNGDRVVYSHFSKGSNAESSIPDMSAESILGKLVDESDSQFSVNDALVAFFMPPGMKHFGIVANTRGW